MHNEFSKEQSLICGISASSSSSTSRQQVCLQLESEHVMLSDALSVIFLLTFKMYSKISVTLYTICIMLIPVTESWVCGVGAGPVIRASDVLTLLVISAETALLIYPSCGTYLVPWTGLHQNSDEGCF